MKNPIIQDLFDLLSGRGGAVHVLGGPAIDHGRGELRVAYPRLDFVVPRIEPWMAAELSARFPEAELRADRRRVRLDQDGAEMRVSAYRSSLPPYFPWDPRKMDPLELDLATREVTVRAVALGPDGAVVDPYGGVQDARDSVLRSIVKPGRLLSNSSSWLLKMAGHSAIHDLPVDPDFTEHARRVYFNVVGYQPEVLREHLERVLVNATSFAPFDFLAESRLLNVLLPEVDALRGFERSSPLHHKDLWDHTLRVVLGIAPVRHLRWVALLHDIGKVNTRRITSGRVSFLRHEEIGAYLFKGIAARLAFPADVAERVRFLIQHHSRINHYDDEWTDTAIRRLMRDMEEHGYLDDLLQFSNADITSRIPERVASLRAMLADLAQRMSEIRERDEAPPLLPSGLGNLLMEAFQLKPGPVIGVIRRWLSEEVEAGRLERNAAPEYYVSILRENPDTLSKLGIEP